MNGENDDDEELWEAMTRDVRRLPGKTRPKPEPVPQKAVSGKKAARSVKKEKPAPAPLKPPEKAIQAAETDKRTAERLRRGQMKIEARLDLHGLNRHQAREALESFISKSVRAGKRCILVITGKGKSNAGVDHADWEGLEPGVLKNSVPEWLSELSEVLKTAPAKPKDGGSGALYVLLRRQKR